MKRKILLAVIIPLLIGACSSNTSNSVSTSSIISDFSSEVISSSEIISSSDSSSEEISSSEDSSSEIEEKDDEIIDDVYRLRFDSLVLKDEKNKPIKITQDFKKEDFSFEEPGTTFNKNLALSSLAFVINSPYLEKIKNVFNFYEFDDLLISDEFDKEQEKDTLLYVLGHKKVNDYDLVNVTITGYNYTKQWAENFNIGKDGNHQGFNDMAVKIFPIINNYLAKYKESGKLKVYINSYSRGAAIANIVSTLLIDSNLVKEENLYAYLFATPQGISANNKEYKSIFNIVNSADIITHIAPKEYGFKRAGIDIELYKENVEEIVTSYNELLNIGTFTPNESEENGYKNDIDFANFLVDYLLKPVDPESLDDKPSKDISTRDNYYNNIESDITYIVGFVFGLKTEVIDAIMKAFNEKELSELITLLQEDGLYNFLAPILLEFAVEYDVSKLKTVLNNVLYFLQQKSTILFMALSTEVRNNLFRLIYFHTLETITPLLINL